MIKKCSLVCFFAILFNITLSAQTHIAIPLGHPIYVVLEQAQMRGLLSYQQPGVKPYSRARILVLIDEILDNDENRRFGRLIEAERRILQRFKQDFSPPRGGLDLVRGTVSFDHTWNNFYFSGQFGIGLDVSFFGGYYPIAGGYSNTYNIQHPYSDDSADRLYIKAEHPSPGDFFSSFEAIPSISFIGDLGRNTSYGLTINGWAGMIPRSTLGIYKNSIHDPEAPPPGYYDEVVLRNMVTNSEPLSYFPYSFKKRWDSFVFRVGGYDSGGMKAWPGVVSLGYTMQGELAGNLFNGNVFYRFARLDREWAGMTNNGSLVLNQSAQPFLALETVIQPFKWISFSALSGTLEYNADPGFQDNAEVKIQSEIFQNAFSIVMLELSYKSFFSFGIGSSVVWPKRFELGYLFPFIENFLYQNNIGDFDNMALFFNLQGQYPGVGRLWFSFFMDELNIGDIRRIFELGRQMFAFQIGGSVHIPRLPFSSITFSYTKNEPYNYTHTRGNAPWYNGDLLMETNYVNSGRSLGHYIPPNSDEFLIRFETIPFPQSMFSLQYQMIRHGANYGDTAVAGSSLQSELLGSGRSQNPGLRKYFLRDGAYQWMHIIRARGEYSLTSRRVPLRFYGEMGLVYSYFTNIDGPANSGTPGNYRIIDTAQYPKTLSFLFGVGMQIFPKF